MVGGLLLAALSACSWTDAVPPTIAVRGPCDPGELVFVDCNLCTCNKQGLPNQVCARMWCPLPLGSLSTPPALATPPTRATPTSATPTTPPTALPDADVAENEVDV